MDYDALLENEIRLIDFGAEPGAPVVVHASLVDSIPKYIALSYCWGTDNCLHRFFLNGQTLILTSSLLAIFEDLQRRNFKDKLWADAICINQIDEEEKAAQIGLMGKVYSSADYVIAWLRTPDDVTYDLVADGIEETCEKLHERLHRDEYEPSINFQDVVHDLNLPPIESRVWKTWASLEDNSWFFRIWTLQEAVLARRLIIYFGSLKWSLQKLIQFSRNLGKANFYGTTAAARMTAYLGSAMTNLARTSYASGRLANFDLLQHSKWRASTLERDKIFSLYNLGNFRDIVQLNLSASSQMLFTRGAKAVIHCDTEKLRLLGLVEAESRLSGLPSWVPDLRNFGYPLPFHSISCDFEAGISPMRQSTPRVSLDDKDNTLVVQGFSLDRIREVMDKDMNIRIPDEPSDSLSEAQEAINWLHRCSRLAETALSGSKVDVQKILYKTLVAGQRYIMEFEELHDDEMSEDFAFLSNKYRVCAEWRNDWSDGSLWRLVQNVHQFVTGRRLFSTKGGRIGLGPRHAQPGDSLVILYGDRVPEVVRERPSGDNHEFVGQAYVHGIMFGEALREHEATDESGTVFVFD